MGHACTQACMHTSVHTHTHTQTMARRCGFSYPLLSPDFSRQEDEKTHMCTLWQFAHWNIMMTTMMIQLMWEEVWVGSSSSCYILMRTSWLWTVNRKCVWSVSAAESSTGSALRPHFTKYLLLTIIGLHIPLRITIHYLFVLWKQGKHTVWAA